VLVLHEVAEVLLRQEMIRLVFQSVGPSSPQQEFMLLTQLSESIKSTQK